MPIFFSVIDQSLLLYEKNGTQKKFLEQKVQVMKVLDSGRSCTDVVLAFRCGKSQIFRIRILLMFTYVHVPLYILLKFNLFKFVISA